MQAENFSFADYLGRIGFDGEARPDLATVTALLRHQLRAVPFENLDVRAGKPISLKPEDIVDKIIHRRRGGYCYEVNGLLALAFTALGVAYRFVGCRPMTYPVRRPRTHMALLATLEGEEWLCDAGFGSYGMRAPMRLSEAGEVPQDADLFQLAPLNEREYRLRAWVDGAWADQYCFDLGHQEWVDFLPANWLNSTHPETLFTQHRVVTRHTPEGRYILFDERLKLIGPQGTEVRELTPEEVPAALQTYFDLVVPA